MNRLVRSSLLLLVGLVLVSLPSVASAQYYYAPRPRAVYVGPAYGAPPVDRPGVYLGLGGFGDVVANQANSGVDFLTSGAGYNLFLGVRLNPHFALEFGWGQGFHNQQNDSFGSTLNYLALGHLTADVKIIIPVPHSNVRPYFQGGVGYYMLTDAFNTMIASGGGFQVGGGLDIWLNPWWSVGGRVLYHGIQFGSFQNQSTGDSNSPYLSTVSIEANIQVHF